MKFSRLLLVLVIWFVPLFIDAQSTSLSNGLVGHWKFDSINTLTTPDESGTGNVGTVGTSSRLVSGKFGQALRFDIGGTGQFMTVKNSFGSPTWTVSAWVNPDLPINGASPYFGTITIFSADSLGTTSRMLVITKDSIKSYQTKIADYSFANNPGWRFVTVTYDGSRLSAYVDGVLQGSVASPNILGQNARRYIGTNAAGAKGHIFIGAIDEVRLYNRALATNEIGALYTNTTTPSPTQAAPVQQVIAAAPATDPYIVDVPPNLTGPNDDPTAFLQGYIDRASTLAVSTGKRVTLKFPPVTWVTDQLRIKEEVIYECNKTVFKKRNDGNGMTNRSIIQTIRMNNGVQGQSPLNYYGNYDNITIRGCTFDSNGKIATPNLVQFADTRNLVFENNTIINNRRNESWSTSFCGRNMIIRNNRLYGGTHTRQDGIHVVCGDNILIEGGYIESGDDAIALGTEYKGMSFVGEDEGITNVTIRNVTVNSFMARCFNAYYGQDFINAGGANRRRIKGVKITGLKGDCAQTHGIGISLLDQEEPDMVFRYRIVNGGSRYNNGTFRNVPTVGGSCRIQPAADVVVTNGVITSVNPANISNEFAVGDECQTPPTLVLTPLGSGTGGSVVAILQKPDNTRIQDVSIQADINISTTTAEHDGITAYGLSIDTGKNINVDLDINFRSLKGNYRPFYISGCQDCTIKYRQKGQTVLGGTLDSVRFGGTIDNVTFRDGIFIGNNVAANRGHAPIYASRGTVGRVNIINNIFKDIETNGSGILVQAGAKIAAFNITGNTFTKKAGATNTYSYNNTSPDTTNVASVIFKDNVVTGVDKSMGLPAVAAPVLPSEPTTKITSNLAVQADKAIYKLGDVAKFRATFTLDPAWIMYLKAIGQSEAELKFFINDPQQKMVMEKTLAFTVASSTVNLSYDWQMPADPLFSGASFSLETSVYDKDKRAIEKNTIGLKFEGTPVVPVVSVNNDGATVDESKVPAGTSPDIFAGVLASRDLLPSQFVITHIRNSNFATTTGTVLPVTLRYTKNNPAEDKARVRFTAPNRLNLADYNVIDVVMENTLNTPIKITLQATDASDSRDNFQAHYLLTANSGPRHLLLPLARDMFKCNDVTGTDDCPASPRQAVLTSEYINGNPPNKSNLLEVRVYADDMTQGSELKIYSMKAMNISYAPQYLKNYIDRYGQNNWVNFPEKVTSDEQLKADARAERTTLRPLPDQWDMYGGDKTATGYGATGKFRVQKVDGKWWLVNPLGNLMYITSITQIDYNDTTGYIGDPTSTKRGAYVELDRSGLLSNAFKDNFGCHGKSPLFCGGTIWSPYISNIIKKYGTPSSTFAEITDRWRLNQSNRLREWGFNAVTARHAEYNIGWRTGVRDLPFISAFHLKGKTTYQKVSGMDRVPDPFDPAFETEVNNLAIRHFRAGYPGTTMLVKDDPYAIGTSADNEIPWGLGEDKDLRNVYNVVIRILEQGSSQHSKVAFTNILKTKYNNDFGALRNAWGSALPSGINSWETFQNNPVNINGSISSNVRDDLSLLLRKFADKYFIITRAAIKREGGESHLYAGVRFANFYRAPREVIDSCAEYCDIITINYYNYTTADKKEYWDYLFSKDKPVLITEFYFDSPSRGSAGTVRPETTTDQEQADAFKRYVRDILTKPHIIGYAYHDMYDQPLLGSIWSENNLTGFVSETDRPYPKLVEAAKDINFDIYRLRGSRPNGNAPATHSLTVGKIGTGSGTISGGTISCGPACQNVFSVGSTVTLTATPTSGNTFVGWSGACTGTGACTITMNSDKVVTAEFGVALQTVTLTVAKVGNGTVTGTGINCGADCTETITVGTNIVLTAVPATGFTFTGWSTCTGTGTCTIPMNAARTITATFTRANTAPADTDTDGILDANDLCPNTPAALRSKVDSYGCPRPKITTFDIRPNQSNPFKNIVNAVLGKGKIGQIKFNQPVDLVRDNTELDIDSNILITNKRVEVRASNVPELNKPATITLYNITERNPRILRNGVACPPTQCVINSFKDGVLTFTVNGF